MKKLAIALVATSALVSQASADVRSGFYIGADVSANALLAKSKWSYSEAFAVNSTTTDQYFATHKSDLGRFGVGGGLYAGYGAVVYNCYYLAGELAYDYNSAKPKHSHSHNFTSILFPLNTVTKSVSLKIKKEHTFNFAALMGAKLTPSTILYIRLGGNVSKVDAKATVFGVSQHKKKTRLSFAPGVGMETSMQKNWVARLEYTYDFGQKVSKSGTVLVPINTGAGILAATTQSFRASAKNVSTHSVKLGIAYKF